MKGADTNMLLPTTPAKARSSQLVVNRDILRILPKGRGGREKEWKVINF